LNPLFAPSHENLGNSCQLTLVGPLEPSLKPLIGHSDHLFKHMLPQGKAALREFYCKHDVLVLPSLGDSFGFAAMEATACAASLQKPN
jgi:glycosyltransferase involved in cell wall biosynthesis